MLPEEGIGAPWRRESAGAPVVAVGRRSNGAERPSWARGTLLGYLRKRPSHTQSCFPAKENTLGVGFRLQRPPAKRGPREPEAAHPRFSRRPAAGWVRNWLACFPELRPGGAGVCCPKSVSSPFADCSAQELGWCRWGDGSSLLRCPAGLGGHCRGLGAECLRTPNTAST